MIRPTYQSSERNRHRIVKLPCRYLNVEVNALRHLLRSEFLHSESRKYQIYETRYRVRLHRTRLAADRAHGSLTSMYIGFLEL